MRQLTDKNEKVTDSYRYNSFGELEERARATDNPYLYTEEYYDEGTGLYYLRARYMNPETGTFISMDSYLGNSYNPVKDFLLGYVTGYGLGAAYYIATALVVASTVDKVLKIFPMDNAGFLGAERNLLQSRGWSYVDGYWVPIQ